MDRAILGNANAKASRAISRIIEHRRFCYPQGNNVPWKTWLSRAGVLEGIMHAESFRTPTFYAKKFEISANLHTNTAFHKLKRISTSYLSDRTIGYKPLNFG